MLTELFLEKIDGTKKYLRNVQKRKVAHLSEVAPGEKWHVKVTYRPGFFNSGIYATTQQLKEAYRGFTNEHLLSFINQ